MWNIYINLNAIDVVIYSFIHLIAIECLCSPYSLKTTGKTTYIDNQS